MPRKSAEALLTQANPQHLPKLDPLDGMTERQGNVWRAVVAALPADYFNSAQSRQLSLYCSTVCQREDVERELALETAKPKPRASVVREMRKALGEWMERENRLARSMRLTHQAVYHKETAGRAASKGRSAEDILAELNEE
jgi:hypothetical protein